MKTWALYFPNGTMRRETFDDPKRGDIYEGASPVLGNPHGGDPGPYIISSVSYFPETDRSTHGMVYLRKGDTLETEENQTHDPKGHAGSLKAPLHLIPPTALEQISWALKHGADKYGRANWRSGKVCATTYIGAMLRHLGAWQDGEDIDTPPGSGHSHLASVAACVCILMDAEKCGTLIDDRSKLPTNETF